MPKKYWDIYRNKSFIRKEAEDKQPIHAPVISFHNWEELRGYTDIPKHGNLSIEKQEELCKAYYACVSFIDSQVGKLLGKLKELLNWIAKFLYLYTAQNIKMPRKE